MCDICKHAVELLKPETRQHLDPRLDWTNHPVEIEYTSNLPFCAIMFQDILRWRTRYVRVPVCGIYEAESPEAIAEIIEAVYLRLIDGEGLTTAA